MANNWQINAIAGLDGTQSRNQLNSDIKGLARNLDKLKLYTEIDKNQVIQLQNQLKKLQIDLNTVTVTDAAINGLVQKINDGLKNIQISNINVGDIGNQSQQVGQQIGNNIAQGVQNGVAKATTAMKSFSQLTDSMKSQDILFNNEGLQDTKLTLDAIKKTYSEFGQVKITNQIFNLDELQSFKVNIEQVNGELKETRSFMMSLSGDKTSFVLPDDVIKGTEKYVQHLNAAKNVINATGDEANALKQKLAEQEKYYGNIKQEINTLYSLKTKLLSADELETAELEKQIKSTKQRITYNNQQIDKKGLRDNSLTREVNDLEVAKQKQLALAEARLQDSTNAKSQAQSQKELNAALKEQQLLSAQANKIQLSMGTNGNTTAQIEVLRNNFTKLGLSADEVKTKMSGVDTEVKTLQSLMNSGAENSAIVTQFEKLQTVLTQTQNNLKQTRSDYSLLATEQQRLSLANTIEAWNQKNTAATKEVRAENDRYVASLRDLNNQMTKIDFNKINTGFKQNENSMRILNRLGASLKDQMKQAANSFTQWISVSSAIMGVVYNTKQAVSELKEVDTLLTEISKANDQLSKTQLKQIGYNSFDVSGKYGKKATDYLSGVQEASRAGYVNAEGIAELSVAAQGAGDMTAELANQYIIATDKAYKFGGSVEKLTEVLDGSNYITNHNAVNMTELAEGMSIVGSQASSLGVGVDQTTAALGTMIATTQQSGSEMARAFKAILLNIQQVSDEEEGIDAEGLTKYEKACNALNVSLKETKNGVMSLRDPMEVIKDLSEEYTKLDASDIRRTNLLSSVGGK